MASTQLLRYVLAAEFALGGQARVSAALTPQVNAYVLSKANNFFHNLWFIPGGSAKDKTRSLGTVMCIASLLFAVPYQYTTSRSRIGTLIFGGTLSTILLIGEATIRGDVWLPSINIGLASWLVYKEVQG